MATTAAPEMTTVTAAVPLSMRAELERLAACADRSLSSEIRRGLRRYLELDPSTEENQGA